MKVKHAFASVMPDDGMTGAVQPSHWNADHAVLEDSAALVPASGELTIDCNGPDFRKVDLTANIASIVFTNLPASGYGRTISIRFKQDATGSRTVALPASFKKMGASDTAVQSAANAYTLLTIMTFDQGTRWEYAMCAGEA